MKKKGFIVAVAAIVTFILVIVICTAIAANPKPSETKSEIREECSCQIGL